MAKADRKLIIFGDQRETIDGTELARLIVQLARTRSAEQYEPDEPDSAPDAAPEAAS